MARTPLDTCQLSEAGAVNPIAESTACLLGGTVSDEYDAHGWLPDGDLVITDTAGIQAVTPDGSLQTLIPNATSPVVGILG
jgi:hypothetical protein